MFVMTTVFVLIAVVFWLLWLVMLTFPVRWLNPSVAKLLYACYPRFDPPTWFSWALVMLLGSVLLFFMQKSMIHFWLIVHHCFMIGATALLCFLPFHQRRRNDLYVKSACWLSAYTKAIAHVKYFFRRK